MVGLNVDFLHIASVDFGRGLALDISKKWQSIFPLRSHLCNKTNSPCIGTGMALNPIDQGIRGLNDALRCKIQFLIRLYFFTKYFGAVVVKIYVYILLRAWK